MVREGVISKVIGMVLMRIFGIVIFVMIVSEKENTGSQLPVASILLPVFEEFPFYLRRSYSDLSFQPGVSMSANDVSVDLDKF